MDTIMRSTVVTSAAVNVVHNRQGLQKFWVLKNLGPAKISVVMSQAAGVSESNFDIDAGATIEVLGTMVTVKLAAGEPYNASTLQWMPGVAI